MQEEGRTCGSLSGESDAVKKMLRGKENDPLDSTIF